ncbi:outer membrane lipoprotein-sorting protein [Deltaproteobacteria bacterium TL4]
MRVLCFILTGILFPTGLLASSLSAIDILNRVDQNQTGQSMVSVSSFIIHTLRGSRTIKSKSWIQGKEQSFSEYLAPVREKGTKMLKQNNNLWIYYPHADRVIKIAGHMLRQSVMGSDLSYEDMLENTKLLEDYEATIEDEKTFSNRLCWVLHLKAKQSNIAYQSRKIWVDQERFLPLKSELYAKSGKLLKIMEIKEVFQIKNRWYPQKMWFKDVLKEGEGTEVLIHQIDFDVSIPESQFSKAALRR